MIFIVNFKEEIRGHNGMQNLSCNSFSGVIPPLTIYVPLGNYLTIWICIFHSCYLRVRYSKNIRNMKLILGAKLSNKREGIFVA